MVTHDPELAKRARRTVSVADGAIVVPDEGQEAGHA